jgi:hypothetical protein
MAVANRLCNVGNFTDSAKEAIVRAVLTAPPGMSNQATADATGCNRESVRRIRLGILWGDVLPRLPRFTAANYTARCTACVQWTGETCGLEIPEAAENPRYARECSAFMRQP